MIITNFVTNINFAIRLIEKLENLCKNEQFCKKKYGYNVWHAIQHDY